MDSYKIAVNDVYIIGCGGVASWLLPPLIKLFRRQTPEPNLILVDGDKLEKRNLDRQLFSPDCIGMHKAEALCGIHRHSYMSMSFRNEYMLEGMELAPNSLVLGCADNHVSRKVILASIDRFGGRAIIGGNEYTDAEAYVYEAAWRGTALDPRKFYPEILTDQRDDPTRPTSCQGVAAEAHPQLVLANFAAANHMLWLIWFHYVERPAMDKDETFEFWPVHHSNTFSRCNTKLLGQRKADAPPTETKAPVVTPEATPVLTS
jgi:hypothetical protein